MCIRDRRWAAAGRWWRERGRPAGAGAREGGGGGDDDGAARLLRRGVQAAGRIGGAPLYRL
eukprot:4565-Prymnesium_polylepis.1